MGPQATVYMFNKIVKMTNAGKDQEHIEIFIHNNTNIPDRTRAILNKGKSPLEELSRSASILEQMGADVLIAPCMTSHYYFEALQKKLTIPIINGIEQAVIHILSCYPEIKDVGLLATTGTIKSRLFQNCIIQRELNPIILSDDVQKDFVMSAIYGANGIKAGFLNQHIKNKLLKASDNLIKEGAQSIIAGCTEIPLVIGQKDFNIPFIDTMEVLARAVIKQCLEN